MKNKKQYEELQFTDDFLFCKILSQNTELAKQLLELLLSIKIRKVQLADSQKTIEITSDGKGVRFDVYLEDGTTVYDVEMQTSMCRNLPKRSRYYQGMIDLNSIERGSDYSDLKRTYVIFICLTDPFQEGMPIYTFENRCQENLKVRLLDESYKVFVNPRATMEQMKQELRDFFQFVLHGVPSSQFTKELETEVEKARNKEDWRLEYMTLLEHYQEEREEGREEGRKEGRISMLAMYLQNETVDKARLLFHATDEEIAEAQRWNTEQKN